MKKTTLIITTTILSAPFLALASHMRATPTSAELPSLIQRADLAGVATVITNKYYINRYVGQGGALEVDVQHWWLGSLPSNRFEIANSGMDFGDAEMMLEAYGNPAVITPGSTVVFFASTNGWKRSSSRENLGFGFDWDFPHTITNAESAYPPRFPSQYTPTVFPVDTNSNHYVNILSNMTESLFITRDKMRFYRAARDAAGLNAYIWDTPYREDQPYHAMGQFMMVNLIWDHFSESNLVYCVHDPLLERGLREDALKRLIEDFGWSPTNSVPVP